MPSPKNKAWKYGNKKRKSTHFREVAIQNRGPSIVILSPLLIHYWLDSTKKNTFEFLCHILMIQNYPISVSTYSCLSRPQNLEKYSIFSESVRKTPPKWHFQFQRQHRGIYIFLIQERKEKKKHIFKIFYWDVSSCSFVFLFYFCVLSTEKKEIFNKISIISLQEFYFEVLHIFIVWNFW